MSNLISSPSYEIRIRGHLGEPVLGAFPGLRAAAHGSDTVLAGALPDQAALHGVLAQVEALGLDLLEVRRRPPSRAAGPQRSNGRQLGRAGRRESPNS